MVLVRSKDLNCARPLADQPDRWEPADPSQAPPPRPSQRIRAVPATNTKPESLSSSAALPVDRPIEARSMSAANREPEPAGEWENTVSYSVPDPNNLPPEDELDDGQDTDSYTQGDPFSSEPRGGRSPLFFIGIVLAACLVLGGIGGAATLIWGSGSLPLVSLPTATATKPANPTGTAKQDFRLRSEPRNESQAGSVVRSGSVLRLLDSAGGEILDPALPEPSKWYKVQTIDGSAEGWAYSGWIDRQQ